MPSPSIHPAKLDAEKARLAVATPAELNALFATAFVKHKTGLLARLGLRKQIPTVIAALAELHQESRFVKSQDRPPNHADMWRNARHFVVLRPNLFLTPSVSLLAGHPTAARDITQWRHGVFQAASQPQTHVLPQLGATKNQLLLSQQMALQPKQTPKPQQVPQNIEAGAQIAQRGMMPLFAPNVFGTAQPLPALKFAPSAKHTTVLQLAPFEIAFTAHVAEVVYPALEPRQPQNSSILGPKTTTLAELTDQEALVYA